jgi:urease accessory protein
MVRGLGLSVVVEQAPFEPEAGAYGHSHHGHGDGHAHEHGGDAHSHSHAAPHSHDDTGHAPSRGFGVLLDRKHDDPKH